MIYLEADFAVQVRFYPEVVAPVVGLQILPLAALP